MEKGKKLQSDPSKKVSIQASDSGIGLAVGLSLGVLVGILIDDIGLGMMIGVAMGICVGPAAGTLRRNKKADEQENDDERK